MVDFVKLGEAMMASMNQPGGMFTNIFLDNRRDSLAHSLDSSPVTLAVQLLAEEVKEWTGTLKELKKKLDTHYHQEGEGWPKSPRGLSDTLRLLVPALHAQEIEIKFLDHRRYGRHVRISFF